MRILLITSDVPATSSMPGSPRAFLLSRSLAQRHEVHLATFASSLDRYEAFMALEEPSTVFQTITRLADPTTGSFWERQRHRLARAPYFVTRHRSPRHFAAIQRELRRLLEHTKADVLVADGLPAAQYVTAFKAVPRVMDAHDAVGLNVRRTAAYATSRWQKLAMVRESRSIRRFEAATSRAVDAYVVNSPRDRDALQADGRIGNVSCIPNGVDTDYFAPSGQATDERALVFTGVMSYAPNRDAVHFFCAEILPRVRALVPDVQLRIVGSDPPADVRALAGRGIAVTGTVPDVRPFVHAATVYVSPLRFGTGVKNKVLAALAMGKAVVATRESCAGLDVTPGQHLVLSETAECFAADVVRLLGDPDRRRELGAAGRRLAIHRYGWDARARQLEALLEQLVTSQASSPRSRTARERSAGVYQ
jgi:sugar transferase (PEP-CTERM/EpsH1 system associated)